MGNEPSLFEWEADWIEALVRGGRIREAATVFALFETRVAGSPRRSARAAVARCRGLLVSASEVDESFGDALRLHTAPTPFERARTELCYGERLRRCRRRADARIQFRSALATFEQLGAAPWAERARRELAATRTPRTEKADELAELLTTHELQVAARVQQGLSNRQIAAALFVTERTVEYHLTNIYRKLEITSRTQLIAGLTR
jgi:DNA-binding CsgD family transcriptional regulator